MNRLFRPLLGQILVGILTIVCSLRGLVADDEQVDFSRDIRPILSDKCFRCHGPDAHDREAELRLDTGEGADVDRDGARVVVPGQPDSSLLIKRIETTDGDLRMPPADSGKELSGQEIQRLRAWIKQGGEWQVHWSYVAPRRHPLPSVKNASWPVNWIDAFILSRLEAEGLHPSADADKVTLIRRLYFDLLGLPPTPGEVERFVGDDDPKAYANLVDALLESPHFGERMAVYWLDLVRYADTVGYHGDQDHSISLYRDYVIQAFNDNLAFDQFTREQLAGDLLTDSTIDQKIATGYNRLLQTSHEGGLQPKEYLAIYAADRIRNLSSVWMGATMGCAQCHDHKYDPYTTRDFYSMQAFFADIDEAQHFTKGGNSLPTARPPEIRVPSRADRRQIALLDQQIADLQAELKQDRDETERQELAARLEKSESQRETLRNNVRTTMVTVAIAPRTIRILPRGNWLDESGPVVEPAIPEFLGRLNTEEQRLTRLDLANWLVAPQQGAGLLTARVFANRWWYLGFGEGISRVMDDMGGQGEPPTHPQLLDNLAMEFVDSGWNLKHMLRLIVTSHTYRQASTASESLRARDPYNRLLARQNRFRLPAEMIRDNALAISGLLVDEVGGASVKPYQPAGYYRHLNFPTRKYVADTDQRQWRRGVYVHWQRQFLHPMLRAFDAPSREECTAQRARSNTPIAALTLLNDPTFVEAARVFAARILQQGGDDFEARLRYAWTTVLSRAPDPLEVQTSQALYASSLSAFEKDLPTAEQLLAVGQAAPAADLDPAQLAAWTMVARALLNLNETITRN